MTNEMYKQWILLNDIKSILTSKIDEEIKTMDNSKYSTMSCSNVVLKLEHIKDMIKDININDVYVSGERRY